MKSALILFYLSHQNLKTQAILIYDSLKIVTETAKSLDPSSFSINKPSCVRERPWELGSTFFNYLNAAQVDGITGKMAFKVSLL